MKWKMKNDQKREMTEHGKWVKKQEMSGKLGNELKNGKWIEKWEMTKQREMTGKMGNE